MSKNTKDKKETKEMIEQERNLLKITLEYISKENESLKDQLQDMKITAKTNKELLKEYVEKITTKDTVVQKMNNTIELLQERLRCLEEYTKTLQNNMTKSGRSLPNIPLPGCQVQVQVSSNTGGNTGGNLSSNTPNKNGYKTSDIDGITNNNTNTNNNGNYNNSFDAMQGCQTPDESKEIRVATTKRDSKNIYTKKMPNYNQENNNVKEVSNLYMNLYFFIF